MKIEIFGCSGGMAEGFRRAGITFELAIDKSPDAVQSYTRNLGHAPVQIDVHDFLRLLELGGWSAPVDLIVADPPCTPWSTAGKRMGLDDERDCLVVTVEIIRRLRPDTFLIGNVPGLDTQPALHVVRATIGSLAQDGYCVADFARLDAADYGVPQHRVRPFWFGHLDGPCLRWPERTHGPADRPRSPNAENLALPGLSLKPYVTCRDALGHLPPDEIGKPARLRRRGGKKAGKKPRASHVDEPAHVITTRAHSGDGSILYFDKPKERDRHPPSLLDEPARAVRCNGGRAGSGGGAELVCGDADVGWPWDRPATTVTKRAGLAKPGHHDPSVSGDQFSNWMDERPATTVMAGNPTIGGPGKGSISKRHGAVVLTEKAAGILQGFPEDWYFHGKTKEARWAQIGQAMPPALAEAVARSIVARQEELRGRG